MEQDFADAIAARAAGEDLPGTEGLDAHLRDSDQARADLAALQATVERLEGAALPGSPMRRERIKAFTVTRRIPFPWWLVAAALVLATGLSIAVVAWSTGPQVNAPTVALGNGPTPAIRTKPPPVNRPPEQPAPPDNRWLDRLIREIDRPAPSARIRMEEIAGLKPRRGMGAPGAPGGGGDGSGSPSVGGPLNPLKGFARQLDFTVYELNYLPAGFNLRGVQIVREPGFLIFWMEYRGAEGEIVLLQASGSADLTGHLSGWAAPDHWTRTEALTGGTRIVLLSQCIEPEAATALLERALLAVKK